MAWEAAAQEALRNKFDHAAFRGVQQQAVEAAMTGRDSLVLMPTGGGKSLCYALPAVIGTGLVVVVSPLIALMQDQVSGLVEQGIHAAYLSSALTAKERTAVLQQLSTYHHHQQQQHHQVPRLQLLYVTPELLDASDSFGRTLQQLAQAGLLQLVAIDEAHCISSWGHDFRPAYRKLSSLKRLVPGVPIMALTATASQQVQQDILSSLQLHHPAVLATSFNRPNITYAVHFLDIEQHHQQQLAAIQGEQADAEATGDHDAAGYRVLLQLLQQHLGLPSHKPAGPAQACPTTHTQPSSTLPAAPAATTGPTAAANPPAPKGGCCIVYALARATVDWVASRLTAAGVPGVAPYHAALPAARRADVLEQWRGGQLRVVVATVAFGMGVDKPDVCLVVHFNAPRSLEGFYQESGRAGRDGRHAASVLLYSYQDRRRMDYILTKDGADKAARKRKRANTSSSSSHTAAATTSAAAAPAAGNGGGALAAFSQVVGYAVGQGCKRAKLLAHFGEALKPAGGQPALVGGGGSHKHNMQGDAPAAAAAAAAQRSGAGAGTGGSGRQSSEGCRCCDWCSNPGAAAAAAEQQREYEAAAARSRSRWGRQQHSSVRHQAARGGEGGSGSEGRSEGSDSSDLDLDLDVDAEQQEVAAAVAAARAASKGGVASSSYFAVLAAAEKQQGQRQAPGGGSHGAATAAAPSGPMGTAGAAGGRGAGGRPTPNVAAAAAAAAEEQETDPVLRRLQQAKQNGQGGQAPAVDDALRAARTTKLSQLLLNNKALQGAAHCTPQQADAVAAALEASLYHPGASLGDYKADVLAAARQVAAAKSWLLLPGVQKLSSPAGMSAALALAAAELQAAVAAGDMEAGKELLLQMRGFPVTVEVLEQTQVAPQIRQLKKHAAQGLAAAAAGVVTAWKQRIQRTG